MLGTKTITASLWLAAAATFAGAATPENFPLQNGNSWLFKSTSRLARSPQSVEVQGTEKRRERDYSRVDFFGRTLYLRGENNRILVFNTEAGQERTWLDFSADVGSSVPVDIDQCVRSARIQSKAAKIKTEAGEWDNAIHFVFEPSCADAGITTMYFVPGVGPVVYETTSIAGPVRWELHYTRAGSSAAEAAQVAFTVSVDAPTYKAGEAVDILVRLTLRNTHQQPLTLVFPSSQRYDMRIWNDQGQVVYVWSADKLFAQALVTETVQGERTFAFTATVPTLAPGRYVAEAWLATRAREYVGVVGFEATR
jgi:hypothetical protein